MKKSVKSLLIMLAVLVVLGGAAACLLLFPAESGGEEEASPASSEEPREALCQMEAEELASILVENSQGSFEIVPLIGEEKSASESGTESGAVLVEYTIEGLEQYELDTAGLKSAAESLLSLTASRSLGEQEDLAQFGLEEGQGGKVTVNRADGEAVVLSLGITSQSGTTGQYILKDGKVYIVPALSDVFTGSALDCVSREVYSVADWTIDSVDEEGEATTETMPDTLFSLEITGEEVPQAISLEYVEKSRLNGYMLTSPVVAESGTAACDSLVSALKSLSADTVEAVDVQEDDLASFGLDKPAARAAFNMNSQEITLIASKKDGEGNRFVMLEGGSVVYKAGNSAVSTWAEADPMDLRKGTICLANIADVKEMSLTVDGDMVYHFTIDSQDGESTVKIPSGQEVSYEDYSAFFQKLTALAVFSLEEAPCEGTPAFQVDYQYKNGGADTVCFYAVEGQDRYACTLNGEFNGLVRGSEFPPLLESLRFYGVIFD